MTQNDIESLPKIKGWVARDQIEGDECTNLYLGTKKPRQCGEQPFVTWCDYGDFISLPKEMFPELTWKDGPIEVEITIKKI